MENSRAVHKTVGAQVLYPELSYQIMEVMYEVHNVLGSGYSEDFYEQAVIYEFEKRCISFESQKIIQVMYKDLRLGTYRLDMVVDGKIILEFKAVSGLNEFHKQQLYSYLKAAKIKLGILINFATPRVQSVRIVL